MYTLYFLVDDLTVARFENLSKENALARFEVLTRVVPWLVSTNWLVQVTQYLQGEEIIIKELKHNN